MRDAKVDGRSTICTTLLVPCEGEGGRVLQLISEEEDLEAAKASGHPTCSVIGTWTVTGNPHWLLAKKSQGELEELKVVITGLRMLHVTKNGSVGNPHPRFFVQVIAGIKGIQVNSIPKFLESTEEGNFGTGRREEEVEDPRHYEFAHVVPACQEQKTGLRELSQ